VLSGLFLRQALEGIEYVPPSSSGNAFEKWMRVLIEDIIILDGVHTHIRWLWKPGHKLCQIAGHERPVVEVPQATLLERLGYIGRLGRWTEREPDFSPHATEHCEDFVDAFESANWRQARGDHTIDPLGVGEYRQQRILVPLDETTTCLGHTYCVGSKIRLICFGQS